MNKFGDVVVVGVVWSCARLVVIGDESIAVMRDGQGRELRVANVPAGWRR